MIIRFLIFLSMCLLYAKVNCDNTTTKEPDHPLYKYYINDSGIGEKYVARYYAVHSEQLPDWQQFVHLKTLESDIFFSLSKELLYDFVMKMRQLSVLEEEYKKDPNYELGVIAAAVMEKFAHMTLLYKKAADWEFWDITDEGRTTNILTLYGIMLSDYNEIRIEKNLFYDIMKKTSQKKAEQKRMQAQGYSAQQAEMLQAFAAEGDPAAMKAAALQRFSVSELLAMKKAFESEEMSGDEYEGGPDGRPDRLRGPQLPNRSRKMDLSLTNETVFQAHEEYKRSLRQRKWLQKWQRFNPDVEGISVSNTLSHIATNESDFLGLNVF